MYQDFLVIKWYQFPHPGQFDLHEPVGGSESVRRYPLHALTADCTLVCALKTMHVVSGCAYVQLVC